ncbi:unnamed protein product [Kuraishia capsulata CBS 1993]|uniref:CHCH domain-containing protein n=1 Tax=Kuraishia capsulata CBS 1993 TaxID=1382522 RepID=W6MV51_9ASCO|nr:uncharacterized protein KUCA_T00002046001 [Kuraishia capsulata CBS 1993]CDK26075.1 unnamed protein product [Kuraishia capsulata CBS 1993]
MPRSSGRRPAARAAPRAAPAQSRPASTMAAPAHQAPAHQAPVQSAQQTRQPGMFAQMASTAAGVAVGSTIGHTLGAGITSMFGGSSAPAEAAPVQSYAQESATKACDVDARNFTRCLEDNDGNFQVCDYYLQQLKACQQAASQY